MTQAGQQRHSGAQRTWDTSQSAFREIAGPRFAAGTTSTNAKGPKNRFIAVGKEQLRYSDISRREIGGRG